MTHWLEFQLARGEYRGRRLLGAETLAVTWKSHTPMQLGSSYGLGWMLHTWEGRAVVEHGGNIDGYAGAPKNSRTAPAAICSRAPTCW
ncbi:MAG TPA: hypothetical protein VGC54_03840, partial [Planctomycetota bacterium]